MKAHNNFPNILNVGLAAPKEKYTQLEIAKILNITNPKELRFFQHDHIKTRHLLVPPKNSDCNHTEENAIELKVKFTTNSVALIREALEQALKKSNLSINHIDYIACITSTAFIVPSLSTLVIENLGLKNTTQRIDIVGMGCNAGLNGLNSVSNWCRSNPGKIGVLICCELCSCIYSLDDSENAAIVNSLFGDGVAVCILQTTTHNKEKTMVPSIIDFTSYIIPASLPLLRFDWNESKNRNSFYVDKKTPIAISQEIEKPLNSILQKNKINLHEIKHWIVHSGGAAILDNIEKKININPNAFRHTRSTLQTYGNVSSGSFLFSYQNLVEEKITHPGDYGLMITMGPGLTIEMALLKW